MVCRMVYIYSVTQNIIIIIIIHMVSGQLEICMKEVPAKWQMHGDLILFPDTSFQQKLWSDLPVKFWSGE